MSSDVVQTTVLLRASIAYIQVLAYNAGYGDELSNIFVLLLHP
jgi:hypothetical protein